MSLLDELTPHDCPNGHGSMEALPGLFALHGIRSASADGPGALSSVARTFVPDGRLVPLTVWVCQTCGAVDLVSPT